MLLLYKFIDFYLIVIKTNALFKYYTSRYTGTRFFSHIGSCIIISLALLTIEPHNIITVRITC